MRRRGLLGAGCAVPLLPLSTCARADALEIDLTGIEPGGWRRVARGDWIVHVRRRSAAEIAVVRAVDPGTLIEPADDRERAPDPEWLVVQAECTHERCEPTAGVGAHGGWRCFCHGSEFDLSGRVLKGPATRNLRIVGYRIDGNRMWIERDRAPS